MREDNRTFAQTNQAFKNACEKAEIPATKRQASKYRNGYGKAWNATHKRSTK